MTNDKLHRIKTISEYHELVGLPKPEHPLISVVHFDSQEGTRFGESANLILDFYYVILKQMKGFKYKYGQQSYDFDEGMMGFVSPNQVFAVELVPDSNVERSGWMLLIHPDFLWNTPLAEGIKRYEYFDYSVHEALFLSDKEEGRVNRIVENIRQEYYSGIDKFSKNIIISHLEAILNYAERFYHRQFIIREKANSLILERLEKLLTAYFDTADVGAKGLPTVHWVADQLSVSPSYLSSLLRVLTGQNTQQHIHEKLIERAKEHLSTTDLSVGEIAYRLGFEHSQSFNRLFRAKTHLTPLAFRQSFN